MTVQETRISVQGGDYDLARASVGRLGFGVKASSGLAISEISKSIPELLLYH